MALVIGCNNGPAATTAPSFEGLSAMCRIDGLAEEFRPGVLEQKAAGAGLGGDRWFVGIGLRLLMQESAVVTSNAL